ncbi:HNH endonuclease [Candidatus Pacearchaeota archaeon]|nr:HNH endonuclease [Candidatus Pacearchaeota archaeon]
MLKEIPEFPAYCAIKDGRIWSRKTRRFLKLYLHNKYPCVHLHKDLKKYNKEVHRLVLETFVGSRPKNMECCHNNGIKIDNRLENLRWDTAKNNIKDAIKHGTHISLYQNGEANSRAKLKEKDIRMIIYMYKTGLFLQREIAEIYNVGRVTITNIINKKSWKHIWSGSKTKPT